MRAIVAVAVLLALAGCTAQQAPPTATAKPVSSAPHVFAVTGSSQQNTVTVPTGARSAEITVTCASDDEALIYISIGGQDLPHQVKCPATTRFRVAAHGTVVIGADFENGTGRYVAQVRFSAEPFASDSRMASQCAAMSGAISDIDNARTGFRIGALDLAGWKDLIASGDKKLTAIEPSGAIGTQLATLTAWYGRTDLTPGALSNRDADDAYEIVNELCLDNGTPIAIQAAYGG